jgi:pimeloyl-ACP methyl ester carboxylesterase
MRICDPRALHRNAGELVDLSTAETLAPRLGELRLPVHYLWGDPRGTGQRSRDALEAAGIDGTPVPHSGHWPFLDQPELFLERLTAVLQRWGQ